MVAVVQLTKQKTNMYVQYKYEIIDNIS